MNKSTYLSLLLSFCTVFLASCDNNNKGTKTALETDASLSSKGKVYRVAVSTSAPPFVFLDEKGSPVGMDIDILNEIAKIEGVKIEYFLTSWNGMFTNIDNKTADIAISGISYKDERNAKYGLSKSYFFNPSSIIYLKEAGNYQTINDLKDKRVATGSETGKSSIYAKQVPNAQVMLNKTPFLAFKSIIQKNADVAIYDQPVWLYLAKKYPQFKVNIVPLEKPDDPATQTVIVTSKSNPKLLEKINDGIQKLEQQNKLSEIEKKWIK